MSGGDPEMSRAERTRLGIALMIATTFVFAMQDGISPPPRGEYNVLMVVMIRYWFFAAFVLAVAVAQGRRSRAAVARTDPAAAADRARRAARHRDLRDGGWASCCSGLIETHAVFASSRC
jgi:hypothetical protein